MRRKKPMKPAEIARLGGHARAKSMSPRARSRAARAAVAVRWQRWREALRTPLPVVASAQASSPLEGTVVDWPRP